MAPQESYAEAHRLMAKVAEMGNPTLPIARAMTAQAAVYAALANCGGYKPYSILVNDAETTGDRL